MSWAVCLFCACAGAIVIIGLYLALKEDRPRNKFVKGVLPPPASDCRRNYIP